MTALLIGMTYGEGHAEATDSALRALAAEPQLAS
jgi:hypothetical protein